MSRRIGFAIRFFAVVFTWAATGNAVLSQPMWLPSGSQSTNPYATAHVFGGAHDLAPMRAARANSASMSGVPQYASTSSSSSAAIPTRNHQH